MIQIEVRGIERLQAFLKTIPLGARNLTVRTVAEYLMGGKSGESGEATHGLKHYPAYRYVNRYAGFPELGYVTRTGKYVPGFASAKQHGYVMAKIASGEITPGVENRSKDLQSGWKIKGEAYRQTIYNDTPYAKWVQGDGTQTRMHKLIGWRTMGEVIQSNIAGAMRSARAKLNEWLKTKR